MRPELERYYWIEMLSDDDCICWACEMVELDMARIEVAAEGLGLLYRLEIRVRTRYKKTPEGEAVDLAEAAQPEGEEAARDYLPVPD